MSGLLRAACVGGLMPVLCALTSLPAFALNAVGEARAADSGELRYTEHHRCTDSGESCEVEYRDAGGEVFARKELDYSRSWHAPALMFEHLLDENSIRVEREMAEEVVVDAGFDHYMRSHWDALVAGERIQFEFLPAGRDSPLGMRAQRDEKPECPQQRLCLKVSLDNWLLGALVPPIQLQYGRQDKRLIRYDGISNLRDAQGKQQQVRIEYRYPASADGAEERSL